MDSSSSSLSSSISVFNKLSEQRQGLYMFDPNLLKVAEQLFLDSSYCKTLRSQGWVIEKGTLQDDTDHCVDFWLYPPTGLKPIPVAVRTTNSKNGGIFIRDTERLKMRSNCCYATKYISVHLNTNQVKLWPISPLQQALTNKFLIPGKNCYVVDPIDMPNSLETHSL